MISRLALALALKLAMLLAAASLAGAVPGEAAGRPGGSPSPAIWAVEYGVRDVDEAVGFYTRALGFELEGSHPGGAVSLLNGDARLLLRAARERPSGNVAGRTYLNFTMGSLEDARRRVLEAGGSVAGDGVRDSAVGPYIEAYDPSGNPFHLIDHPWDDGERGPDAPPALFNIGLSVADMAAEESFFTDLGFQVATRDYLPETLVFERAGMSYFVMHVESPGEADAERGALVLGSGLSPRPAAAGAGAGEERGMRSPSGILVRTGASGPSSRP